MRACSATFLILSFLIPELSSALEFQREGNKVILQSPCSSVDNFVGQLDQWRSSLNEAGSCPAKSEPSAGNCRVDVTDCLPKHARENLSTKSQVGGANCWNLALVAKGILPAHREVQPEEWVHYLKPPLCRELGAEENILPGDLGAIRVPTRPDEHVHGFMYISGFLTYSKKDAGPMTPYEIKPARKELLDWDVRRGGSGKVTSYRCISMAEYLKQKKNLDPNLFQKVKAVDDLEQCMSAHPRWEPLPVSLKKTLEGSVQALATYLAGEMKKPKGKNQDQDFLLERLDHQLRAVVHNLYYRGEEGRNFQADLEQVVKGVAKP